MSVEILREAAALMRSRAEAATPAPEMGPRAWMVDPDEPAVVLQPDEPTGWDGYAIALTHSDEADRYVYTPHIASWHPAVAVKVAAWLESEAAAMDAIANFHQVTANLVREEKWTVRGAAITVSQNEDGGIGISADTAGPALAVARAYLGEATDG